MVGRVSLKNKEMSHTFQHAYFTIWHDFSWHIKESRVEKTILFWMRNFSKGRRTALKPGSGSCSNAYILVFFSFQQEIKTSNTLFDWTANSPGVLQNNHQRYKPVLVLFLIRWHRCRTLGGITGYARVFVRSIKRVPQVAIHNCH